MDDTIRSLIRFVARGFYSKSFILVLDAVLIHSVLSEDDLIYLLGIQRKELRMFCNKLVEDRLLSTHIQKEENPQQRLISRTYYYIHITEAIDSIKWKVHSLVNNIKQEMTHYGNPQGYICPRCKKKFSQLDAISLLSDDKTQFVCDNCTGSLIEDDSSQQASIKQANLEKLMIQIDPIIAFLKKIDDSHIDDNTFESALVKSIPAQTTSSGYYSLNNKSSGKSRISTPNANLANKNQATLHVSISATDEHDDKEQQEKEEKRQKLQQNALPSWHSASTVGHDNNSIKLEDANSNIKSENDNLMESTPEIKEEPEESKPIINNNNNTNDNDLKDKEAQDALAAYYAQLAEREADDDDNDDDDDDDDDLDEDNFEDI